MGSDKIIIFMDLCRNKYKLFNDLLIYFSINININYLMTYLFTF